MMAINQVCHERQLPTDIVIEAVEVALISAYKRNFGGNQSITAQIDPKSGAPLIFVEKLVVEQVENDKREILLKEAQALKPKIKMGEMLSIESTPKNFGRIAAQTAKQVILQRIREAERDALYASYAEREGEIISGTVHKVDSHQVTLSLGKAEAVLPRSEQVPTESYREGQRLRAYIASVTKTTRGPQIVVSRTHRSMLRRLLEVEVPEIYNGTVEIKSIAREAGYRSKVAVAALQEGVDPVGSCVGMRGTRIQNIVNELNGEKIDVVQWNPDMSYFIANSLSPARVMNVMLSDDHGKTAMVVVPDKQLSLAIGKEGQNARLAAKLTGWRIDIKSASEAIVETLQKARENEAIKARITDKVNLFNMAASILTSKAPLEFSEGELNLFSEVIETVYLAQNAIERERRLAAEAARKAAQSRDLLAEAEAILSGKSPLSPKLSTATAQPAAEPISAKVEEQAVAVEEVTPPLMAEVKPELEDVEDILAEAEALLAAQVEVETVVETQAVPAPPVETAPKVEPQAKPVSFTDMLEDEWEQGGGTEEERRTREQEKKKAKEKKRRLVFDERLGEVVTERRRKNNRRTGGWQDNDE